MDDSVTTTTTTSHKRPYGHRQSRSVSSLPLDLQSLSLQGPEENNLLAVSQPPPPSHQPMQHITPPPPPPPPSIPVPQQQQHHEPYNGMQFPPTEKAPSWMIPNDRPPMMFNQNESLSGPSSGRRKPSFAGHGRSVSEFTLPPLSNTTTTSPLTPPTPPISGRMKQSSHRRAVSANTIDFMLAAPLPLDSRAQSYSPKEPSLIQPASSNNNSNTMQFFDQLENSNGAAQGTTQQADSTSGRYVCPYCHKKFSRPSSLRIHTYSHTGEKPFECDFPGCGRHFSVQSNMRRHLRVHRLGRGSGGSNNASLETTNEEA